MAQALELFPQLAAKKSFTEKHQVSATGTANAVNAFEKRERPMTTGPPNDRPPLVTSPTPNCPPVARAGPVQVLLGDHALGTAGLQLLGRAQLRGHRPRIAPNTNSATEHGGTRTAISFKSPPKKGPTLLLSSAPFRG